MTTTPLRTERLVLTPLRDSDAAALQALFALAPVCKYLLDGEAPTREWVEEVVNDSQVDFARRGLGLWAVRRIDAPDLVGIVGFRDFQSPPVEELIYALHPDAWGSGLAGEMAGAAIAHAFSLGRRTLFASADAPNEASLRVLRRLGFREHHRTPPAGTEGWEQVHWELARR